MRCRSCETEIDDNALICFRCGTAATDPVHQPLAEVSHRRRALVPVVLGVVFVGVAGFFVRRAADGAPISPIVWVMLGVAGILLAYRLCAR